MNRLTQIQVNNQAGLTFAAGLRSLLRHDPDTIMVGEIRDEETAEIAVHAALTGHLVLSTLHTNDAPSTISRMINMGVEPFLVSSSVLLIVAQRLLRRLCDCKQSKTVPDEIPQDVLTRAGYEPEEVNEIKELWGPKGCPKCNNSGYKGRVALYEVMEMTGTMREMVLQGASTDELRTRAVEEGMLTLRRSGLEKARNGMTSLEEVLKVTLTR
jgi:type IV pilus assembly protein PilB